MTKRFGTSTLTVLTGLMGKMTRSRRALHGTNEDTDTLWYC